MTTLVFPESRSPASTGSSSDSLRQWLGEHWAILFSHPEDFDQEQLERDRWLSVLRRSFSVHGLRALALARHGYDGRQGRPYGWLAELGDGMGAALSTTPPVLGSRLDFSAMALRAEIARSGPRFAMVIDSEIHCHRTMHYRAAVDLPSPIELVGWAVALRDRQSRDRQRPAAGGFAYDFDAAPRPRWSSCGSRSGNSVRPVTEGGKSSFGCAI